MIRVSQSELSIQESQSEILKLSLEFSSFTGSKIREDKSKYKEEILALERVWIKEKCSPELYPFMGTVVREVMELIQKQVE